MTGLLMDGRGVLIAGGGRGIGRACAELLAAHGARVLIADPSVSLGGDAREGRVAAQAAEAIRAVGGDAEHSELGIGSVADGERLITLCRAQLDTLDAVLVPAIVLRDRMIHNLSQTDWDLVLGVNLTGVFGLVRAALPMMRERGYGRIVTFTSRTGLEGRPGTANYAAAKMGVVGLVKTVAKEARRHGVLVNCIAPRAQTRATDHALGEVPAHAATVGYKSLGSPEDVAKVALHLASEACRVTGKVFTSSGCELGVYPEPVDIPLADGSAPLTQDRIAELIGALGPTEAT